MSHDNENKELTALFPGLAITGFARTSPATPSYNCIAWAMGDTDRWWESGAVPGYHWPEDIKDDGSVRSVVAAFRLAGFKRCSGYDLEAGYDRIVIYGENGEFTHVARQLGDGSWTSKIGKLADLSHPNPECLCGIEYGYVEVVMRKQCTSIGGGDKNEEA